MLDNETIKALMQEKSILQIIWIVLFAFFLAIVKVFYLEMKKTYSIIRSVILSVSAGLIAGLICYHF
jgi:predicted small secreted protein